MFSKTSGHLFRLIAISVLLAGLATATDTLICDDKEEYGHLKADHTFYAKGQLPETSDGFCMCDEQQIVGVGQVLSMRCPAPEPKNIPATSSGKVYCSANPDSCKGFPGP